MPSPRREPDPGLALPPDQHPLKVYDDSRPLTVKRVEPTVAACLRCQLVGRRRLLCSRADTCRDVPRFLPLGPLLLLGWLVTVVAFVLATR